MAEALTNALSRTHAMAWIPGGEFAMGDDRFYPEERPMRSVRVDGVWMDEHPVTVAEFRRFVKATGHVTHAELPPDPRDYPDAEAHQLVPGSIVFRPTPGPVSLDDNSQWWAWVPGACWHRPEGPGSDTYTRGRHPVVHIAHSDAQAYAKWAGKSLPSEAEWERAGRGGLERAVFAWGDDPMPDGREMANTWRGDFPWRGHRGTSPVGTFPANGFGLYDMTGNVWEWTADVFGAEAAGGCCAPGKPGGSIERRVIKGGSHLCAPSYCLRYRPAARQGEPIDSTTSHIGFRCVSRTGRQRD